MKTTLPLPASLRNLPGKNDMEWIVSLIPVLVDLHKRHPEGWRAPSLQEAAHALGLVGPDEEIVRSKYYRALQTFERVGYLTRDGNLYYLNLQQLQRECEVAWLEYQKQAKVAEDFSQTLLSAAALGPSDARRPDTVERKTLISQLKSFFTR
jgi:hypothetical protein